MISLCITNYNRTHLLIQSFQEVYSHTDIDEIIIVDDCSDGHIWDYIKDYTSTLEKVKLYRNDDNLGMSRNKKRSVELAKNEWCIVFDSDNILPTSYVNTFVKQRMFDELNEVNGSTTIYCPSFAKPQFDFTSFSGITINKHTVKSIIKQPNGEPLLNCCNYVVNRSAYLNNWRYYPEVKGTDTIHFAYDWLNNGGSFYVVPKMEYFHRVHEGSGFLQDADYNMDSAKKMKEKILTL